LAISGLYQGSVKTFALLGGVLQNSLKADIKFQVSDFAFSTSAYRRKAEVI
jgi:hypothetical protein